MLISILERSIDILKFREENSRKANFRDVYVICFGLSAAGLRLKCEKCRDEQVVYEPQNCIWKVELK